jgi:DNA-binding transcriptional MerR regulator
MDPLDFVNKLSDTGIRLKPINADKEKEFEIGGFFDSKHIIAKDFQLRWKETGFYEEPIKALLSKAVDMDSWKHSWHIKITPENYKEIEEIIQGKILARAKETEELLSIYFQLHHEISK